MAARSIITRYDAEVLPSDSERIERLERQVQYLLRYVGVDPDAAVADFTVFGAGSTHCGRI